jgi:hypothetical protein
MKATRGLRPPSITQSRVAGLIGVSVVGVVVAQTLVGDTFAATEESVRAFHQAVLICVVLVAVGGVLGAVGITNPRRLVAAEGCSGGQLVAVPRPAVNTGCRSKPPRARRASIVTQRALRAVTRSNDAMVERD